jgi:hypothetical protein
MGSAYGRTRVAGTSLLVRVVLAILDAVALPGARYALTIVTREVIHVALKSRFAGCLVITATVAVFQALVIAPATVGGLRPASEIAAAPHPGLGQTPPRIPGFRAGIASQRQNNRNCQEQTFGKLHFISIESSIDDAG